MGPSARPGSGAGLGRAILEPGSEGSPEQLKWRPTLYRPQVNTKLDYYQTVRKVHLEMDDLQFTLRILRQLANLSTLMAKANMTKTINLPETSQATC